MLNPKLIVREVGTISGKGMFATETIEEGELLWEVDPKATVISLAEWWPCHRNLRIDIVRLRRMNLYSTQKSNGLGITPVIPTLFVKDPG